MDVTDSLWLLGFCCVMLAIAPLWFLYRAYEIGSRSIARIGFWAALLLLGLGGAVLALNYAFSGLMMFFIAILYPLLLTTLESKHKKQRLLKPVTNHSVFRSGWLELAIDQQSGKFSGNVLQGKMQHWHLHEMDGFDLLQLRAELLNHDVLATALLDTWLDREGPTNWRQDFSNVTLMTPVPPITAPTREEAAMMLGVAPQDTTAARAARERLLALLGDNPQHAALRGLIEASAQALSAAAA